MFTGPLGSVEVLFYWPEDFFGNFDWPEASSLFGVFTLNHHGIICYFKLFLPYWIN